MCIRDSNLSPCVNKYGEGSCEGVDADRCEGKDPYNPNGGPTCGRGGRNSGCRGWPIEPRMSLVVAKGHGEADTDERCRGEAGERSKSYNKKGEVNAEQGHMEKGSIECPGGNTCQKAFRAYFCYLNFPRCYWDDRTDEMKSVPLCRSACKNFFKACNYDKSLWRCGRSEWMNGNEPEDFAAYGRYMRDFFPGQPFRNSYKSRGYRNIHGRCTPGVPDDEAARTRSNANSMDRSFVLDGFVPLSLDASTVSFRSRQRGATVVAPAHDVGESRRLRRGRGFALDGRPFGRSRSSDSERPALAAARGDGELPKKNQRRSDLEHGPAEVQLVRVVVAEPLHFNPEFREFALGQRVAAVVADSPYGAAPFERDGNLHAEAAGLDVTHVYGLTETYGPAALCQPRAKWAALTDAAAAERRSRQGVAHAAGGRLDVVDPETGAPVPRDGRTMGEVVFGGNVVMKGYLKDEAATAAAFRLGALASGDLAVKDDDGYVAIRDRSKDLIISGGENVSSLSVEAALMEHDAVALCAVVARPDEKWGETPCAFVETSQEVDAAELLAFAKARLPKFAAPKTVVFGELPRTSTGKIQKFVLRERAREL